MNRTILWVGFVFIIASALPVIHAATPSTLRAPTTQSATTKPRPKWRDPKIGDIVEYKFANQVRKARVVRIREGKVTVAEPFGKRTIDREYDVTDVKIPGQIYDAQVGERVMAPDVASYTPAWVVDKRPNEVLVQYDGWSKTFNKWVPVADLRPPKAGDTPPPFPAETRNEVTAKNPLGGPVPPTDARATTDGEEVPGAVRPDLSKVQTIAAAEGPARGTLPDKGRFPTLSEGPIALQLTTRVPQTQGAGTMFPEWIGPVFASPESGIAAIGFFRHAQQETQFAIERLDLIHGKSLDVHLVDPGVRLADISPSGKLVAFDNASFSKFKKTVQIFSLESADAKRIVAFRPYFDEAVTWTRFVDDTHLLTLNFARQLTLWKIPEAQAIYRINIDSIHSEATLSPNRKQILVTIGKQFVLLDTLTGQTIGRFDRRVVPWGHPVFSGDGTRIMIAAVNHVIGADVLSGDLLYDAAVPAPAMAGFVEPVDNGLLMLNSKYLFDPKQQIVIWHYSTSSVSTMMEDGRSFGDRFYWLAKTGQLDDAIFLNAKLPHAKAANALATTKLNDMMTITPGMSVSLEVNVTAPGDPAKIREYLTKAIEKAGLKLGDNQPIKLIASNTPGKTAEVTFREGVIEAGKRTLTDQTLRLAFERGGEVLWETTSKYNATEGRPTLILKNGQTLDQALAEEQAKSFEFFTRVAIPGYVQKKSNGQLGLGSSTITVNGIKDD